MKWPNLNKILSVSKNESSSNRELSDDSNFFSQEWWSANRDKSPKQLQLLTDQFLESEDFSLTSKYWLHLIKKNLEMLDQFGLEFYAQTLARNYFTWVEFNDHQIKNICYKTLNVKSFQNIFKKHEGYSFEESYKHNILIYLLYLKCKEDSSTFESLKSLRDSGFLFGGSPFIYEDGIILTLDKLSSLIEIQSFKFQLDKSKIVCELGGGSGRTMDAILQLYPDIKAVYSDIPPASYVALERFQKVFPNKIIRITNSDEELLSLLKEPTSWDILMIPPKMLKRLPTKSIDLFIAIDCLHEFGNENRANLSQLIEKVAVTFYTKNWTDTIIPFDDISLSTNHLSGYYFPSEWNQIFKRECTFPGNFTELLYFLP